MPDDAGYDRRDVGRAETVAALRRRFAAARGGSGGITLVLGDTGVGKTPLLEKLTNEMRESGVRVLVGRAPPVDDPPPFSLLRSAVESIRNSPAPDSGGPSVPGGGEERTVFAPPPGPGADADPVSVEMRLLALLDGTAERSRISQEEVLAEVAERFREFLRKGATVVALHDLHRADGPSLAAVGFLVDRFRSRPFWVLATSQPASSLSEEGRARLERFVEATRSEMIPLRPTTGEESSEGRPPGAPERTLPVGELPRGVGEGHLVPAEEAREPPVGAPAPRDEAGQRLIDIAAVLGPEFSFDLLRRVQGGEDLERLAETVHRLVEQGLLLERPGETLAFPEDRLREAAYNRLPDHRRRLLHWSAGESLEGSGTGGLATTYALARHFYLGRAGAKSVRYNRLAAEIAEGALAPEVAREHLARALESLRASSPRDAETESGLVLDLARVTEELGRLKEADRILAEFLEREKGAPRLSARRRATLEIFRTRVLTSLGQLPQAVDLAQKVLTAPGLERELLVRVGAHHQLGIGFYYEGRYPDALAEHTEELAIARETGNPLVVLHARIWRIAALAMMGETDAAIAEAREVTAARDRLGSVRESAQAHLFFGDILADARSPPAAREEAVREFAEAIRFAERAEDPRRVGYALYKTSELLREAGELASASEKVEEARAILSEVGDPVGLSMTLKVRGQIALDRGEFERAEADLLEAHKMFQGLPRRIEELDVVLRLGQLYLAKGNPDAARRRVAELEQQDVARIRPDLVTEFERLKAALR